ncbi:MAG: SUMF1/EgtB/PvdO family nonheme iron enzyme [Deinococcus sp.]|nr:SUMF1/EgtB/PvdO family nonheme iron enzyme [Deinococcus sp.]
MGRDSVIEYQVPADGTYLLQLQDYSGRSGPDYFYRLTLNEVVMTPPLPIALGETVTGTLSEGRAPVRYSFTGTAGTTIRAEIFANREGSALDSILTLLDEHGNQLASNDDTAGRDSLIEFQLPADGTYTLQLQDYHRNGGPTYFYRLMLSQPPAPPPMPTGEQPALAEMPSQVIQFTPLPVPEGDINLTALGGVQVTASSAYNEGSGPQQAVDGDVDSSFFTARGDAANLGTTPFLEVVLPGDATVSLVQVRGNRHASGYDVTRGRLELFDADDTRLFSRDFDLLPPDQDADVATGSIAAVRRVRFTFLADESDGPGFSELLIWGQPESPLPTGVDASSEQPESVTTPGVAAGNVVINGVDLVSVPAGPFTMGTPLEHCLQLGGFPQYCAEYESPQHQVTLAAYYIMRTEVTIAQYDRYLQATGARRPEDRRPQLGSGTLDVQDQSVTNLDLSAARRGPEEPVTDVAWYEARAFCAWLGQETPFTTRLPTEAEWEKAARGTDGRVYPWGNTFDGQRLNFADVNAPATYSWRDPAVNDGFGDTAPVGSFPDGASPYGALDMAGNVAEMTSSLYWPYPYVATDGRESGGATTCSAENLGSCLVYRGGSFRHNLVHAAGRAAADPIRRYIDAGFRCAAQAASP